MPPPFATPTPTARPTPTASPTPSPTALPTAARTARATPGLSQVPRFTPGSLAATRLAGLRVRSRPGTEGRLVATLGPEAELLIGLGPILVDGLGWYLVRDGDDADPRFDEGWVAAGFEPEPFLVSSGFPGGRNPFVGGFADATSGEYGPILPPDAPVAMRWIAATNGTEICNFAVDLSTASGAPVRGVRTPVGSFPASGELPASFFASNFESEDGIFVLVQSDCSWAVSFVAGRRR